MTSTLGVVAGGTGGVWRVLTDDTTAVEASLRGRLKKSDTGRRSDGSIRRDTVDAASRTMKLAVGDRVRVEHDARANAWVIAEILPRTSRLARRAPGGGHGERVLAANLDQVLVMFAAARPDPHPRMLDRFLVIAEANQLPVRIVINKVELVGDGDAQSRFAAYERVGYPVHYVSVKEELGLEAVRDALVGRVSVVSGPSGVGKSSLLNALFPGLDLRVGDISESVNKGRHTTVGAYLHPLPGFDAGAQGAAVVRTPDEHGGAVVDTPGLREIGMWELPVDRLDQCFPEFLGPRERCRFSDCAHVAEPDCGVLESVAAGEISAARYDSYLRLREEIAGGSERD